MADQSHGFDSFDLKIGDLMRGERATMGKSLLDVEREIRIKASYIAAIENADPDAFDTPGFIPGYVRSYARYLDMDPDEAFAGFCREAGFSLAHGMSANASSIRKPDEVVAANSKRGKDPLLNAKTPFAPASESWMSRIEPGAIGSATVLVALIAAIGYGGWSVLNEVQRVQFAPIENTPSVLTDLDPLNGVVTAAADTDGDAVAAEDTTRQVAVAPTVDVDSGFTRAYRPEALDVPVLIARDAPISTLDPGEVGTLRTELASTEPAATYDPVEAAIASVLAQGGDDAASTPATPQPQVLANAKPGVRLVAVRPAWVQIKAADGSTIFSGTLNGGETYDVATLEEAPELRIGESGAVYFEIEGQHYGPVGPRGTVTKNLPLAAESLAANYEVADLEADQDLERYVAELQIGQPQE